jgi:hypothetical protein
LNRFFYSILLFVLPLSAVISQTVEWERFVQVNGFITDETNKPVSGVAIISVKLKRGTVSEWSGIYSITSKPGDTILYRALGYKKYHTIIPPAYEEKNCTVDIVLQVDTIAIADVKILPWKTYAEFIKDMTKEIKKDPLIENMNDNIASIYVAITNNTGVKVSPEAGYRYAMEQNFSAMATRQQYPVNNLLNPFAWAKFINGVKNGLLKNQKIEKPAKQVRPKSKKKSNSQEKKK